MNISILFCFITMLLADQKFFLDPSKRTKFNVKSSCPKGYHLASLDDPSDWEKATQLAFKVLGPEKAVWIRSGLGWLGTGTERWTIITPKIKGSCKFPPADLESFCVPIYHFRLSPNRKKNQPKLPSICEIDI